MSLPVLRGGLTRRSAAEGMAAHGESCRDRCPVGSSLPDPEGDVLELLGCNREAPQPCYIRTQSLYFFIPQWRRRKSARVVSFSCVLLHCASSHGVARFREAVEAIKLDWNQCEWNRKRLALFASLMSAINRMPDYCYYCYYSWGPLLWPRRAV